MNIRCSGGWTDREHAPLMIGEKEPISDTRITDGACDACARAMKAPIICRWCEKIESSFGLCERCELGLSTKMGVPIVRLTVFRQSGLLAGNYDGAGAVLRLRGALKEPDYRGFQLVALQEAVR